MATPMRSTQFSSIVEPILNEAFDGVYNQRKDEWKPVFRESQGITRSYHEEPFLFGMGSAPEMPEGSPVRYDAGGVLYNARYVYQVYGLAFALTQVLIEDGDHIEIGRIYSEQLAQSLIETKETNAANILNRAFNSSYTGGDGVTLVNTSHPARSGTAAQSNRLAANANLSQTSLEQMLIQIRKAQDPAGKYVRLTPQTLVVSPDNIFQAEVITKSILRAGTANNDLNPINSIGLLPGGVTVMSRLTSPTAFFVKNDVKRGLQLKMRRKLKRTMEGDFETDSMRYKATERYKFNWTDWRDLYGTPGI